MGGLKVSFLNFIIVQIFLFVSVALAQPAGEPKEEDESGLCGVVKQGLQKAFERARAKNKAKIKPGGVFEKCEAAYKTYFDSCTDQANLRLMECESPGAATETVSAKPKDKDKGGIGNAADKLAEGLVNGSNCKRRMAECIEKGGVRRNQGRDVDANNQCYQADEPETPVAEGSPEAEDRAARNDLADEIYKAQGEYRDCLRKKAQAEEDLAKETLENALLARSDGERPRLVCLTNSRGERDCEIATGPDRYSPADGQREDGHQGGDPDAKRDNPVRLSDEQGRCSGTVLGDGETVVTAGHCVKERSQPQIYVRDESGRERAVLADCRGQVSSVGNIDLARCRLTEKVAASPVYFATLDESVPGNSCVQEGYVRRCGTKFFEELTDKPVTIWGYPAGQDGLMRMNGRFTHVQEPLLLSNGRLYHDSSCGPGCSGAGYVVDVAGERVVVGAHSWGVIYPGARVGTYRGGGSLNPFENWQGLRVQSVSSEKLGDSTLLFQQMQGR